MRSSEVSNRVSNRVSNWRERYRTKMNKRNSNILVKLLKTMAWDFLEL